VNASRARARSWFSLVPPDQALGAAEAFAQARDGETVIAVFAACERVLRRDAIAGKGGGACRRLEVDVDEDAAGLLIAPISAAVDKVMAMPNLALVEAMRVALRHRPMLRHHSAIIVSVVMMIVGERRRGARKGQCGGENCKLHSGLLPGSGSSKTD
jgi:hypothetical protein